MYIKRRFYFLEGPLGSALALDPPKSAPGSGGDAECDGGGDGDGDGGGGGGGECPDDEDCADGGCSDEDCEEGEGTDDGGMARWGVMEPRAALFLHDKPFYYRTSRGREVTWQLHFKNIPGTNGATDTAQPGIFSVGTNWHTPWRSYLQASTVTSVDPTVNGRQDLAFFVFLGNGSARQHPLNVPEYSSRTLLTSNHGEFRLTFPSGSCNVYGQKALFSESKNKFIKKITTI